MSGIHWALALQESLCDLKKLRASLEGDSDALRSIEAKDTAMGQSRPIMIEIAAAEQEVQPKQ